LDHKIAIYLFLGLRIRIYFRIQGFDDQKFIAVKIFKYFLDHKIAIYLSLGLHKGCTSYRRSRSQKRKKPAIIFFLYICGSFLPSWIRIRIQQLKLMRIHADPDLIQYSRPVNHMSVIKALTFIWIVCDPWGMGLDSSVADLGCLSRILIFIHPGSQIQQKQQKKN
jgi:hypothetical protein